MSPASSVQVLLAADSPANRQLLRALLATDAQIRLVGVAGNTGELASALRSGVPMVLLMDLSGRGARELPAIAELMRTHPLPVVVCGDGPDFETTPAGLAARRAGAVACVDRPESLTGRHDGTRAAQLLRTLKLMSEVRVVRRHARRPLAAAPSLFTAATAGAIPRAGTDGLAAVGIGASTGGPPVLREVLSGLPSSFSLPVLVVQHIAPGFLPGLAQWLGEGTPLQVHIASHGSIALPGHVYLAPDGAHLGLGPCRKIILSEAEPENHVRPSVSFLFRTLVHSCGATAIGVLLTGMGRDGADELKRLRDCGGVTIAQDAQSSVVHGMAGTAIADDAASLVLPAGRIAAALVALADGHTVPPEGNTP